MDPHMKSISTLYPVNLIYIVSRVIKTLSIVLYLSIMFHIEIQRWMIILSVSVLANSNILKMKELKAQRRQGTATQSLRTQLSYRWNVVLILIRIHW